MIKAVVFDMYETLVTLYQNPLYFGQRQMAAAAGIPEERFRALWKACEADRTTGKMTLEELLTRVLQENGRYSQALLQELVHKRVQSRREPFDFLHPEILPLLDGLRDRGILRGLISNCFSEEAAAIRESALYPCFDVCCLSWLEGVQKPDAEIFQRCLRRLRVRPAECLYVGDGGSGELEAASALGMRALQAGWYLKTSPRPAVLKPGFRQLETPLEVLRAVGGDS